MSLETREINNHNYWHKSKKRNNLKKKKNSKSFFNQLSLAPLFQRLIAEEEREKKKVAEKLKRLPFA